MTRLERRAIWRAAEHLQESGSWPAPVLASRGAVAYRALLLDLALRSHRLAQERARRRWGATAEELVEAACTRWAA